MNAAQRTTAHQTAAHTDTVVRQFSVCAEFISELKSLDFIID